MNRSFLRCLPGHFAHILSLWVEFLAKSRANEKPEHRNDCNRVLHFHCTSSSILLDAVFAPHFTSPNVTTFTSPPTPPPPPTAAFLYTFRRNNPDQSAGQKQILARKCILKKKIPPKNSGRPLRHLGTRCDKNWRSSDSSPEPNSPGKKSKNQKLQITALLVNVALQRCTAYPIRTGHRTVWLCSGS